VEKQHHNAHGIWKRYKQLHITRYKILES